jgi:hypothetical protein
LFSICARYLQSPSPLTSRLASGLSGELVSDMLAYPWMHVVQLPRDRRAPVGHQQPEGLGRRF